MVDEECSPPHQAVVEIEWQPSERPDPPLVRVAIERSCDLLVGTLQAIGAVEPKASVTFHDGPSCFVCPECGATSYNPTDVEEGYCGRCHAWTRAIDYDELTQRGLTPDATAEMARRLATHLAPLIRLWTDRAATPARMNAIQAEWPELAARLDELAGTGEAP